jgi:hypothetical protein
MGAFGDTPLFSLLIFIMAVGAFTAVSFRSGKRKNREICARTFQDLLKVFEPDEHIFTNIGGAVGHHAAFSFRERGPVSRIDVTLTLLPRQAPLYMPISKLIMKSDRLFISIYMRYPPPGEGHMIEKSYAGFRGSEITNISRLDQSQCQWGGLTFFIYYEQHRMLARFIELSDSLEDPGPIRHIAVVPDQRKGFVLMALQDSGTEAYLAPVYQWLFRVFEPY